MCGRCKTNRDCQKGGCTAKAINQCSLTRANGTYVITKPGNYTLSEDVRGTISIQTSNVCLDLCCHTIDANGAANAIVVADQKNISISNGAIINSTVAGISLTNVTSVEIFDLFFQNNALDAIFVTGSTDVSVSKIDSVGTASGERFLHFVNTDNIVVKESNATSYLSTLGAIIQFEKCDAVSVQDVNVTNNTKTSLATVDEFTAGTALVFVETSTGVDFVRVKVNNNTFNNTVAVADQNNHWRTAEGILFKNSNTCSLHRCETSDNTDIAGNLATLDTEDFMLQLLNCFSFIVTEHQANSNSSLQPLVYLQGITASDSSSITFDTCQANDNTLVELANIPGVTQLIGFELAPYFISALTHDLVLLNSQANGNTVTRGGAGRIISQQALVSGILVAGTGNAIIDKCQANRNRMVDFQPFTYAVGILSERSPNVIISNSTADFNTGSQFAIGILFESNSVTRGPNVWIKHCSASYNGNVGISMGALTFITGRLNADAVIDDCVIVRNGTQAGPAAGIFVVPVAGNTRNLVIKDCQIFDTGLGSTLSTSSAGISVTNATNVVIENTNVFDTTAPGVVVAHGILFDNVSNSKIIRTQLHRNKTNGVNLNANTLNNLVQDSYAVANLGTGFNDQSAFANAWFGNEAQANGVAYSGVSNVATFSKSTGVYVPAAIYPKLTNIAIVA
jgi:hypothetical protein